MRAVFPIFLVVLSGCATVAPPTPTPTPTPTSAPAPAPWFIGHFTASYVDARGTSDFSVTCSTVPDCETTIEETKPRKAVPQKILSNNAQRINVDVFNNNLQAVRAAVAATPKLYDHINDGPLLRSMRPVIESGGKFTECLGVAPDGGDSIALCQHSSVSQKTPILLFSTMKPTCADNTAFCAYYLLPLNRQR